MKYMILGDDNKEYGPVDSEALKKWVEGGRVLAHTPVRNSMIKKWNKAEDFDFLHQSLALQVERLEEEKSFKEKSLEALASIFRKKTSTRGYSDGSAYRNRYQPDHPGIPLRILSFSFDSAVFLVLFILFFLLSAAMVQGGHDSNSVFMLIFPLFISSVLVYYGLALGLYAQTFGMWFWGLMIVKADNGGEVFLGRAYFYAVTMFLLGLSSPVVVFLSPVKRSVPELLSGTAIIKIAARVKA